MTATPISYRRYLAGLILSCLLAAWLALLGLVAVTTPNLGWGAVALITGAIWVGVPLALLLLIAWVVYLARDRGRTPGRIHALLFLPTLAALSIVPIADALQRSRHSQFDAAHGPITETHINLAGGDLWPDTRPYASTSSGGGPSLPMSPREPGRFTTFTRYPDPAFIASGEFPYDGARLKDGIDRYTYRSAGGAPGASLPLARRPVPDLAPLVRILGRQETPRLAYLYFHYPDRVEAVPVLRHLSGMTEQILEEKRVQGLVLFVAQAYAGSAIARLEINGQTLDLGERAIPPQPPFPAACRDYPRRLGGAFVDIDQPLSLRWQTVDAPDAWQTASLRVPDFRDPTPVRGQSTLQRVMLYFLPDGTVAGERFVQVDETRERRALRATGMPPGAGPHVACGSAYSDYNPETVRLLE
ncbi:hypothetical protein [Orrella dioscoreae]|uniref:Uncharacterized protein n=1 Tax=Orrella dioscoreae TaxID=1851544 RepID=A0A1C3K2I2_9BURK|nr:hypothetical protein [Orrella dioscoreae]SBT25712.1 hypothetical protein ODI_01339 [Orrella dioscoreae]SOE52111.1 hypothetical protein ODI_R3928 [Orrella dioscoreae]